MGEGSGRSPLPRPLLALLLAVLAATLLAALLAAVLFAVVLVVLILAHEVAVATVTVPIVLSHHWPPSARRSDARGILPR